MIYGPPVNEPVKLDIRREQFPPAGSHPRVNGEIQHQSKHDENNKSLMRRSQQAVSSSQQQSVAVSIAETNEFTPSLLALLNSVPGPHALAADF